MTVATFLTLLASAATLVQGLRYHEDYVDYNLNSNKEATDPLDYSASWPGHTYHKSPVDWRFPFYTIFLDRLADGDPTNNDINGTVYEQDITSNQLRHGGDIQGLIDSLDYIQGMGMRGIYIAGSPFINLPWGVDSYSPVDLTLLDPHYGNIKQWQDMVKAVHDRDMYVMLDHTFSTMSDLLAFKGFENETAPFLIKEHLVHYKGNRQYLDFQPSNNYKEKCEYPRFWDETGMPVGQDVRDQLVGCYDSDFDQYGDIEAFGVHPDWQRSLAKFASVQDRLREWVPSVRKKLELFSCMTIQMLDVDGFRFDKATQITVDAMADHNEAVRECARKLGKDNFFLPGEITGGNGYGTIYIGRGKQDDMKYPDADTALNMTTSGLDKAVDKHDKKYTIRDKGKNALDAGAFHYSTYRFLTRFVGMSGNLEAGYDLPRNWTEMWNEMVLTNDFVNPNTNQFDPRHMHGTMNQDVFRWSGITQGTERMLLGFFIMTLHMPGIPLVFYGEEQEFYVLDSTADNYIFGRQAFSPTQAWKNHGCHAGNSEQYINWPIDSSRRGCEDPKVALDHRDASAPVRNIIRSMYFMRDKYQALKEGWLLEDLGRQTFKTVLEGSNTTETEFGIYSVARAITPGALRPVWFVYHNQDKTTEYKLNCKGTVKRELFLSPFDGGDKVKNLFYPYDVVTLEKTENKNGYSAGKSGCLSNIKMEPFEFRAYVKEGDWKEPPPMITKFSPGHDTQLNSAIIKGEVEITFEFSREMSSCDDVAKAISISSKVDSGGEPELTDPKCSTFDARPVVNYVGGIPSKFRFTAKLKNVGEGTHRITVKNAPAKNKDDGTTGATDHFFLRVGADNNPVVYPESANYSSTLVTKEGNQLFVNHAAPGADKWRYSTNWASSWSDWKDYKGGKEPIDNLPWKGTSRQAWKDDHVMVQYWSKMLGSSSFMQSGDSVPQKARRFPHVFAHGTFNKFGFDAGIKNELQLTNDGEWEGHLMDEWPTHFQLNIWGMNPDEKPDAGFVYGDVDGDGILDRMPPSSLALNVLNATDPPPMPALSYKLIFNDATLSFRKEPRGNMWVQIIMFILLFVLPIVGGLTAVWIFMGSFYKVKINKVGFKKRGRSPLRNLGNRLSSMSFENFRHKDEEDIELGAIASKRRKVIIATMEYNIDDWNIKIKIGGLGVMAQLMGKALEHQDLIWVVPCVGGIDYPVDQRAEPMYVPIMGNEYEIEVQYHQVQNITYVLLDAPIFRTQTKTDPYPPRMDDIDSAIYYSAWNYCIAETIRRFNPDLYHINDYHGAAAPLYLLPERTIPCALSLHNAEFQGMWPMRNPAESKEVCEVFNLDPEIVKEYVQFGSVFNLLHAGSSYLRVHQKGFGAVGVSKKYGDRSYARYPIFWGLSKIGQLPNPDPSDTAEWSRDEEVMEKDVVVDLDSEAKRGDFRRQAQEWAGLKVDPTAELFVFVGRWSLQKGVDLIADIFPSILEKYPTTQLIAVGPVIDLYGKFAALKLEKLMAKYPGRVYSKPEFTALPPYIFTGAEFALIPSRDEPFGLVAVEFGRKGALGVGARVGGLGQMPGFWYTIESTAPQHLLHQFREAIVSALECKQKNRAMMRAWSAKQRFPVAQWVEDLDTLQGEAIRIHGKEAKKRRRITSGSMLTVPSNVDLNQPRGNTAYFDEAGPETPLGSTSRSRASSLSVPFITETDHDVEQTRRQSAFDPFTDAPSTSNTPPLGTPGTPPVGGANEPFLPPNPMFANQSARSSVTSLATIVANNDPNNRLSVDTFAMRMMSPDSSETAPGNFALPNSNNNPQARPGASTIYRNRNSSRLSVIDVVGDRNDFKLQKVDPFFTDSTGDYYRDFDQKLNSLTAKNSETDLCIEDYLKESEKTWFKQFRDAKLGRGRSRSPSRARSPSGLLVKKSRGSGNRDSRVASVVSINSIAPSDDENDDRQPEGPDRDDQFLLGDGYKPPKGLKKFLSIRFGDWPVYSFILALGQIISANSYQVVLLAGEAGQKPMQLYIVAGTYLVSSLLWWGLFRRLPALYSLSLPWLFYGLAFMLLGVTPFMPDGVRSGVQNTASALYACGASSGALFFAMNFGDEGGVPIMTWIFRAAVIQGIQQAYIVGLWYWGSQITGQTTGGLNGLVIAGKVPVILVITVPIALIFWALGVISFIGLPDYYRQSPDKIPSFYMSLVRRHIVPWFFFTVIIQNYFLSAPYGRNWEFLFYSKVVPGWAIVLLAFGVLIVLWALLLWVFAHFSKTHPWIVPLFGIGLGAPRWAQMLWGTSGIGLYLPWMGGAVASALMSRTLWLWLGLLDTIQGVGLGMVLLLTLTRQHVAATLIGAQALGAAFTILARATAPNKDGPGDVFPDFSQGVGPCLSKPWFWIVLALQLILPIGFFKFFRKEQVAKP